MQYPSPYFAFYEGNKKNEALERKLLEHEKKNSTLESRLEALEKQQQKR